MENNIEKDTKVIQVEQKKFIQLHKQRIESFNKATSAMKKHRKKKNNAEKELKCIQALEEEKKLLDNYCDQSIKNALIQERRRYGFVMERCVESLAKHWSQYFEMGHMTIANNIAYWQDVAETREMLPTEIEIEPKKPLDHRADHRVDHGSVKSNLKNSESIHASTASIADAAHSIHQQISRPRAMSEHSLTSSHQIVTALYPYLSSGENQLSFYENDKILLVGEKIKPMESYQGWQFGENLMSGKFGWFPISYVQHESDRCVQYHYQNINV